MRRTMVLESLEMRRLLTTELQIFGTSVDDHVTLWTDGSDYVVDVNSAISRHPIAGWDTIRIFTFGGADNIDVRDTHDAVTVTAGAGEDFLYVGGGRLDTIRQSVTFEAGEGNDTVVLDDWASAFDDNYTIDGNHSWRTLGGSATISPLIAHSFVENVTLNASGGTNVIDVERAPSHAGATNAIAVNCPSGNDQVRLAPTARDLVHIPCNVRVTGGLGASSLTLNDQYYLGNDTYTVTATTIDYVTGGMITYENLDELTLNTGPGHATFVVNATASGTPLTVNAGDGDDALRLSVSNLLTIRGDVTFNGGVGADSALLNDQNWDVSTDYVVSDSTVSWAPTGARFFRSGVEQLTLNAGRGGDEISVQTHAPFAPNLTLNGGLGADTFYMHETGLGSVVTLDGGAGEDVVHVNPDGTGFAGVVFASAQDLAELTIGAGGRAVLSPGGLSPLRTRSLSADVNGTLNITDNVVAVDYSGTSPIGVIHSLIGRAYNGGDWLGAGGITSSAAVATPGTAVGYAEAVDVFAALPATFGGMTVDATSVLIRHTVYGDANLDGRVNLADFNRLATHFGHGLRFWAHGNLDYDVDVDLADFNRLAANFGASLAAPDEVEGEIA